MSRSLLTALTITGLWLLAGCAKYDAEQARQSEQPLGDPPAVEWVAPDSAGVGDTLEVVARVTPGTYDFANYNLDFGTGETIGTAHLHNVNNRIEIENRVRFAAPGSHMIFATVWDSEHQSATDSTLIVIHS